MRNQIYACRWLVCVRFAVATGCLFGNAHGMTDSLRVEFPKCGLRADIVTKDISGKSRKGFPINKMFDLSAQLGPSSKLTEVQVDANKTLPVRFTFDARMPEHNHGMVVKPRVAQVGDGIFTIAGVKLHMEGKWELLFDVKTASCEERQIVALTL